MSLWCHPNLALAILGCISSGKKNCLGLKSNGWYQQSSLSTRQGMNIYTVFRFAVLARFHHLCLNHQKQ